MYLLRMLRAYDDSIDAVKQHALALFVYMGEWGQVEKVYNVDIPVIFLYIHDHGGTVRFSSAGI